MICGTIVLICSIVCVVSCNQQSVCVKGRLVCSDNPTHAKNALVKLWDQDRGPNPDDLMATMRSNRDGSFELCGKAGDGGFSNIDPELKIYHNCQHETKRCLRKTVFGLPDKVIDSGTTFDMGDINLDIVHGSSESTECF